MSTTNSIDLGRPLTISMMATALTLTVMPIVSAQNPLGKWNAAVDPRIIQGAENPAQNPWNAMSPWGDIERVAPVEAQRKAPFKIFDNVYYVGFQTVNAYLVVTSAGLVLIDSGYEETVDWLLSSIRQIGFDPTNIGYVFVTHAHADHLGGADQIQKITGARVGMSLADWQSMEAQRSGASERRLPALKRDLIIGDGQFIEVGDTKFHFYITPGHTPGATSIEYQVTDGDNSYRALTPGGLGLQYSSSWGPIFKASMQRLQVLGPWDVMLSNHPFLMPRGLADISADLEARQEGSPNPAVLGERVINRFFEDVLKIVERQLVEGSPTDLVSQDG